MSTVEKPAVVVDDKKYLIEDLSDEAKTYVATIQNLGVKLQNHQMKGLQLQAAQESLTNKLRSLIKDSPSQNEVGDNTPIM